MVYKKLKNFPHIQIPITRSKKKNCFFVSCGEYPIYDKNSYDYMEKADKLSDLYLSALKKYVKNKKVLDVGTGAYFDWAYFAAKFGAKKVVGLEGMKSSYLEVIKGLKNCKYKKQIELENVYSDKYETKEKFDVCVSEIIGTFGSSEGIIYSLNDVKKRLLKKDGIMIPNNVSTYVGAVDLQNQPSFEMAFFSEACYYIDEIFKFNEFPFDLRLTIDQPNPEYLISDYTKIEDLNLNKKRKRLIDYDSKEFDLKITKNGIIDGLMFWIEVQAEKNGNKLNTLFDLDNHSWENLFIPLNKPLKVKKGDILHINYLRGNDIHPDYYFTYYLNNNNELDEILSMYNAMNFRSSHYYKKLFKI